MCIDSVYYWEMSTMMFRSDCVVEIVCGKCAHTNGMKNPESATIKMC